MDDWVDKFGLIAIICYNLGIECLVDEFSVGLLTYMGASNLINLLDKIKGASCC